MSLLSAAELKAHPEFQNLEWKLPPTKEGKCAVAGGRGGPFDLWYEVHGVAEGGIKLVVSLTPCYFGLWRLDFITGICSFVNSLL